MELTNKMKNVLKKKDHKEEPKVKREKAKGPKTKKTEKPKGTLFERIFSVPLLKQSIKSNLSLWLILSIGTALIFIIVNIAIGTKKVFSTIDMNIVSQYVADENMQWLQILGLLDTMGFKLSQIQIMSQLDLNAIMSDLVYKIAGVLLPMIYVIIAGNKLIASQVNDGSMAYVLSTPTARKKVVRTQWFFLATSLIGMYIIITIGAFVSGIIGNTITGAMPTSTYTLRTVLFCLSSFCAIFCLMGVCFCASSVFNKSNMSIAIGGGACVLAFIFCVLGLFANDAFVAVGVGVSEMNFFNYLTVFSLIDTDSLSNFCKAATRFKNVQISYDWIWKDGIAFLMGVGLSIFGSVWFCKKDLPL